MSSTDLEVALEDMRRENEALRGQLVAAEPSTSPEPPTSPELEAAYWRQMFDGTVQRLSDVDDLNTVLEREADEREAKLKQRDEDLAVLTSRIKLLDDELDEVRVELARAQEDKRIAESDLDLLKAVRDKAYGEIGDLQVKLAEAEMAQSADLVAKLNDTEQRLTEAEGLASDLDTALAKANSEIAGLARQLDEAKTTLGHAGTALERAMQPMIELVDVQRGDQHWVEVRVSLDEGQTTRLAALIDAAGWNGYLRLYPEHLGLEVADQPRTEG